MRRNSSQAITPQMYRHFATVTVAITALMAFFANGENQQAAATAAMATRIVHEPPAAPPKPQLEIAPEVGGGTWGSEAEAVERTVIGPYASASRSTANPFALDQPRTLPPDAGSDDREDHEADAPAAPTASQIAAIEAASRLRSGARGYD